jgi:bla regulator protein blaR1
MQNILYNISQVLGITIIHSLWQGLLIYFMLRLALMFSSQLAASKKYLLAVTSLLAISGWFVYTLITEIRIYNWLAIVPANLSAMPMIAELPAGIGRFNDQSIRYYYSIEKYLPFVTILYIVGLLFHTTRLILARKKINTIRQTMSIDVAMQYKVNKFTALLNIGKKVKVGLSKLVDVPCMAGYFKPVILLPFTLSTYLSAQEIESILLHELAHIKRNDYLVNMLQQVLSILLFFNPCVMLINHIINEERENCCDDLVVKATADPIIYAKALLKLEQTRQNDWKLALAATGKKYHLLNRIERIMKTKKPTQSLRPALAAMLILTIGIGSIALLNPEIAQGKISVKVIKPVISHLFADTTVKTAAKTKKPTPYKRSYKAKSEVKVRNGNKTSYAYNYKYNSSWGFHDAELERLSKEVEKHGDAIGKYYESPEFKRTADELEQKGKEVEAFYSKPERRELQERQEKLGADFEKNWGETPEMKETSEKMEKLGKKIETYYNSPEFKKMNEALEKKYGIPHNRNYNDDRRNEDENYRKYQAEVRKNTPPEINQQTEDIKQLGSKMREHYSSPEFQKQKEQMRATGDSMRKAFHNPQIKEQQAEMRELGNKMRDLSHNPEIEKEKVLLKEATAKMHAYMNTPEFKKRLETYKKEHPNEWDDDQERPEKPEKPEAPEKPEPPENNN